MVFATIVARYDLHPAFTPLKWRIRELALGVVMGHSPRFTFAFAASGRVVALGALVRPLLLLLFPPLSARSFSVSFFLRRVVRHEHPGRREGQSQRDLWRGRIRRLNTQRRRSRGRHARAGRAVDVRHRRAGLLRKLDDTSEIGASPHNPSAAWSSFPSKRDQDDCCREPSVPNLLVARHRTPIDDFRDACASLEVFLSTMDVSRLDIVVVFPHRNETTAPSGSLYHFLLGKHSFSPPPV